MIVFQTRKTFLALVDLRYSGWGVCDLGAIAQPFIVFLKHMSVPGHPCSGQPPEPIPGAADAAADRAAQTHGAGSHGAGRGGVGWGGAGWLRTSLVVSYHSTNRAP